MIYHPTITDLGEQHAAVSAGRWRYRFHVVTLAAEVSILSLAKVMKRTAVRVRRNMGLPPRFEYVTLGRGAVYMLRGDLQNGPEVVSEMLDSADQARHLWFQRLIELITKAIDGIDSLDKGPPN